MSGISLYGLDGQVQQRTGSPVRAHMRLARWRERAGAHWLLVPALVFAVHFLIVQLAATFAFQRSTLTANKQCRINDKPMNSSGRLKVSPLR